MNLLKSHTKTVWTIAIGFSLLFILFYQAKPYFMQNDIFNIKSIIYSNAFAKKSNIPPMIHYIYLKGENGMVLEGYRAYIQNCLEVNPDMKFILWTRENMNFLLKTVASKEMQFHMEESNRKLLHRSDIFRYMLLYYFGGIYIDLDTICIKPIYPIVRNDNFVLAIEPPVHTQIVLGIDKLLANHFFASIPRHPFMKYLLDNLNENPKVTDDILKTTGPLYVDKLFPQFVKSHPNISMRILNSSEYFPEMNLPYHRNYCKDKKIRACEEFESYNIWLKTKGYKEAVIAHEGLNFGWTENAGPNFNATQAFPALKSWP